MARKREDGRFNGMKQLVLDNTKCTGCSLCMLICSLVKFKENNPKKAAIQIKRRFPEPGDFQILICNQCGRCREVCPNNAIFKRDGVDIIDPEKCNFCKICIEECPLNVLFTHKSISFPIKCDLCGECIFVCAPRAIQWSD